MNGYLKSLAQWLVAVAIVGFVLAVLYLASVIEWAGRRREALVVWARTRPRTWRAALRTRAHGAVLPALRVRVRGTHDRDVATTASADVRARGVASLDVDEDFVWLAEYSGVIPFDAQVRR